MSDGTIEQVGGTITFHYERQLASPIETVWKTLTDPAINAAWFGGPIEIDPVNGTFVSYHAGGLRVLDQVAHIEPPTLLQHTFWQDVNPSALVTWRLAPAGDRGCTLTLMHTISLADVESVAAGSVSPGTAAAILARTGAGWHRLLDKLEAVIDGTSHEWPDEAQRSLQDRYAAMLP